jgi:hypothetical protein
MFRFCTEQKTTDTHSKRRCFEPCCHLPDLVFLRTIEYEGKVVFAEAIKTLDGGQRSTQRPRRFTRGKERQCPLNRGWVEPRGGLDVKRREQILAPAWIRNPDAFIPSSSEDHQEWVRTSVKTCFGSPPSQQGRIGNIIYTKSEKSPSVVD